MRTEGKLKCGEAELWYSRQGSGPSVVLLHAGIADSRSWEPQVPALAEHFDVICYDRRGFGKTTAPAGAVDNIADLAALLDHLDVQVTHLVGCSQGGKIAVDFTLSHPERVSTLVVVSSALSGHDYRGEWPAVAYEAEEAEEAEDLARLNELEVELWVVGSGRSRADLLPGLFELSLDMNGIALNAPEQDEVPSTPLAIDRLHDIRVPTLVVTGSLDVECTLQSSKAILEGVPGARGFVLDGTAHLPNLERPVDFNHAVLDFLR